MLTRKGTCVQTFSEQITVYIHVLMMIRPHGLSRILQPRGRRILKVKHSIRAPKHKKNLSCKTLYINRGLSKNKL